MRRLRYSYDMGEKRHSGTGFIGALIGFFVAERRNTIGLQL